MSVIAEVLPASVVKRRPRLGFLGVGWIGRNRMEAIRASGLADIAAIADESQELAREVATACGAPELVSSLDHLLELQLDGIVIATPSALHAAQAVAALERGVPVFCQKPLGRNYAETRAVVDAARRADLLLGVDLSYRFTAAVDAIRTVINSGELGSIYAAELVFHNAYGPDKPWFFNPSLSGGGCVIDLGIHLVDLAMWLLDAREATSVVSRLYSKGARLTDRTKTVEDFASALIDLPGGTAVRLTCSWNLPAGQDAVIEASFYGTSGAVSFRNVNGSFYDFVAERNYGTRREQLVAPPDAWGGRAAVAWAERIAAGARFDPEIERVADVARVLDAIYDNGELRP